VPKKFQGNRRGIDSTCFAMCQSGQKIEIEAGLTYMIGLSCNMEEADNLGIENHCRKLIPFGHAKLVLPSQCSSLDRNLGKLVREIG
jgi:hypothetical protein